MLGYERDTTPKLAKRSLTNELKMCILSYARIMHILSLCRVQKIKLWGQLLLAFKSFARINVVAPWSYSPD
jgi:hypothetical protein